MFLRHKIYTHRDLYDLKGTDAWFFEAIKKNLKFHINRCPAPTLVSPTTGNMPSDGTQKLPPWNIKLTQ